MLWTLLRSRLPKIICIPNYFICILMSETTVPKNCLPLSPTVFTEERHILDFPICDRKTILHVRRRKWTTADGHNHIVPLDSIVHTKTQYSKELALFKRRRMDNEPVTAKSLSHTYMIDGGTFEKNYKEVLSDFRSWSQGSHASDWVLLPENMGEHLGIDETSFCHEVYTILHNKDGHGRKHTVIAIIKGTKPSEVIKRLMLPEDIRLKGTNITMDLSNSMGAIAKAVFPKAVIVRDCFHVIRRGSDGIEEIRLRLKREAIKEQKKEKAGFNKKMDRLAKRRKAYRERHRRPKGRKRGRKPMRRTSFTPQTLSNLAKNSDSSTFLFCFCYGNSPCIQIKFLFERLVCNIVQHSIIICINSNRTTYYIWRA